MRNAHRLVKAKRTSFLCKLHDMDEAVPKPDQAQRLVEAREKRGFKDAKAAARYFSFNYDTYIQHERGERGLTIETAERYGRAFKVLSGWLLTGEGGGIDVVPLISWVSAGELTDPDSQIPTEEAPMLPFADLGAGDWFALRVVGDSMNRVSPDGSIILVDRSDRELVRGRKYVFSLRGEATYKQWEADPPRLQPLTTYPDANPTIFPRDESEFVVVGRVRRSLLDL